MEYWGGCEGTLGREKAEYEVNLDDGILKGTMFKCPSVGELLERRKEVYYGNMTYCDHCRFLYPPIAREYGFEIQWYVDFDETGRCIGTCRWISFKNSME